MTFTFLGVGAHRAGRGAADVREARCATEWFRVFEVEPMGVPTPGNAIGTS